MHKRALLICILLLPGLFLSAQSGVIRDQIKLQADFKDIGQTVWRLWGNVIISFEDYQIYAQYLQYNTETHDIYADGQVIVVNREHIIRGEHLLLNTKTRTGDMYQVMGYISPYLEYQTEHLHQVDDDTFTFEKLSFSSCSQRTPRWQIAGGGGTIKKSKYILIHDLVVRVKGVPVFYLPYLYYPVHESQRSTGFQMPKFGYSAVQGFFAHNSFYWDIADNLDATLYGDYFSNMGVGTGSEFRYLFQGGKGNLTGYLFFYSADNTLKETKAFDYSLIGSHQQTIPSLNSSMQVSLNYASNASIQRVLNNSFDRALTATYMAQFNWTTTFFHFFNLSLSLARTEIYFVPTNSSYVQMALPSINLIMPSKSLFGLPGRFSLQAGFKNGLLQGVSYLNEPVYTTDVNSPRFSFNPEYTINTNLFPWMGGGVTLESYTNLYLKSLSPLDLVTPVGETLVTNFQKIIATVWGPVFTRVFEGDYSKIKHSIYPEIKFQYSTAIPDDVKSRVIRIDAGDFPGFSSISASLFNTLDYKSKETLNPTAENLLYFKLSQTYYFDPAEANQYRTINAIYPQFSELSGTLSLTPPGRAVYISAAGAYNFYLHGFSNLNLQAGIGDAKTPFHASLGYLIDNNPYDQYRTAQLNFLNRSYGFGQVGLNLPEFPLSFTGDAFYDLTLGQFRYLKLVAKFDYQCLTFHGDFSLNLFGTTIYPQFTFGFTFGNFTGTAPAVVTQ
jgi:hypothetical protein